KPWRWLTISKDMLVNEGIRARELRLIDHNGEQLGVKSRNEALEMAARVNLDLVLVAPNAKPPVARIMDYGKHRFELQKKEKEAHKSQTLIRYSDVRLSRTRKEAGYHTMFRNGCKSVERGDNVKAAIRFRGRAVTDKEIGQRVLNRLAEECADLSTLGPQPKR